MSKEFVKIVEVGPRDGLQNEGTIVPTADKIEYVKLLMQSGLKTIEATSFVKPSAIAQMSDATEVFQGIKKFENFQEFDFPCLVPNEKGLENALSVGVSSIALFTATSQEFNKKNINASIEESFKRFEKILESVSGKDIRLRGYVSTVFGCPYEGEISTSQIVDVVKRLNDLGMHEISLGDTIGVATPNKVEEVINALEQAGLKSKLAMHFHDTRGMAIVNIKQSLDCGIRVFDSASGGLGGCPYAVGSAGNVATEDVLYLLESLGFETGVDIRTVAKASQFILEKVKKSTPSKYLQSLLGDVGDK